MQTDSRNTGTEAQIEDAALLAYLDSLLQEATTPEFEKHVSRPADETLDKNVSLDVAALRPDIPALTLDALIDLKLDAAEFEKNPDAQLNAEDTEPDEWQDGRPSWAKSRFEVLFFESNGVKLAVPLIELGLIHNLDKELNRMAGHPDWIAGILPVNGKSVLVVDTLRAVMPEKPQPTANVKIKYAITINGTSWGLSCTKLMKAQSLEPEQVKWRTARGNRGWLIGTVLEQMCSLVDVKSLARDFEQLNSGR